jgi:hypothetical protein
LVDVLNTWRTKIGADALDLEAAVLVWWREQGAVGCKRNEVPAGDGFTECVHVGRVDVPRTVAYVEELRAALS